jgi:hypothetical protein
MRSSPARLAAALALATAACAPPSAAEPACGATDVAHCAITQEACFLMNGTASCMHCGAGQHPDASGRCVAIAGTALSHDFPEQTVAMGAESLGLCRSWTLNNAEDLWVTGFELTQNEASHHSNWTFAPEGTFPGADGIWNCRDRGYDQLSAAVAGGVIYAQSTQATHEVQVFPEGAAVRIPAHSVIFSDIHLLNLTTASVTGHASITLYTVPRAQVSIPLTPFHITYQALALPPHERSRAEMTCDLDTGYRMQTGHGVDLRMFYALPHTHALGTRVFLQAVGGPIDGQMLLDVQGSPGEARGTGYGTPIDLTGITGLRFGCEFENPTTDVVHWGFGNQEMCEMLGFMQSDYAFEGRGENQLSMGMDGTTATFDADCQMLWLDWSTH